MTSSDVVGKAEINPQQEGFFYPEVEVERAIQINFEGQKAGEVKISTLFKVINWFRQFNVLIFNQ